MKKVVSLFLICFTLNLFGSTISKEACDAKEGEFIYAGGECINYAIYEGDDNEKLIIIVHGTWDEGANVLGRYAPFAETLNLNTDVTTIAVALPGYSKSSLNTMLSIGNKKHNHQPSTKAYVEFIGKLVTALKEKYKSQSITYVGHSAGAMMGASLAGMKSELLDNIVLAGGRYDIKDRDKSKTVVAVDVLSNYSKKAKFILVYGTADKISKPKTTTSFYDKLTKAGLNAKLVKVQDAAHIDLDMTDPSVEAITELFEE